MEVKAALTQSTINITDKLLLVHHFLSAEEKAKYILTQSVVIHKTIYPPIGRHPLVPEVNLAGN